jgi:hypothetical protein
MRWRLSRLDTSLDASADAVIQRVARHNGSMKKTIQQQNSILKQHFSSIALYASVDWRSQRNSNQL